MDIRISTFNEISAHLLRLISIEDILARKEYFGIDMTAEKVVVPFFGRPYYLSSSAVIDSDGCSVDPALASVLLAYCIDTPEQRSEGGDWISYRELEGAGPLMGYFNENTGKTLERTFSGDLESLSAAGIAMGGVNVTSPSSFDLILEFTALPRVPVQIRFNDAEEGFPASCRLLFQRCAQNYLDLKSLGVIGTYLCGKLLTFKADTTILQ